MKYGEFKRKLEGFWSDINKPIPNELTLDEANKIFHLIKIKEKSARKKRFKGPAFSRLDKNIEVGSAEYSLNNWSWPAGFAEHYVLKHHVKPSESFLKFIGY